MSIVDSAYSCVKRRMKQYGEALIPYARRGLRFMALPYAFFQVNWNACTASKFQVIKDFFYIFFVLKDYPDYYSLLRLWEKSRPEWAYYYGSIYNPHQRGRLRSAVQKKEYKILFEDKYVCHKLCRDAKIPVPDLLGYCLPGGGIHADLNGYLAGSTDAKIIIKPVIGRGGEGIFLCYAKENRICVSDGHKEIDLTAFKLERPSILQKYISQHPDIDLFSTSINTVRIETLLTVDNDVLLLGAFMRFGQNGTVVDNQCTGGLSVGVHLDSGLLYDFAMDGRGEKFYRHPDSDIVFQGFQIPHWGEVKSLVKRIQNHFFYYKLLGADIAITPEGPVVVEINSSPDHAGLEMDYGPVFKDKKVWEAFREYNLLINEPSRNLYHGK